MACCPRMYHIRSLCGVVWTAMVLVVFICIPYNYIMHVVNPFRLTRMWITLISKGRGNERLWFEKYLINFIFTQIWLQIRRKCNSLWWVESHHKDVLVQLIKLKLLRSNLRSFISHFSWRLTYQCAQIM